MRRIAGISLLVVLITGGFTNFIFAEQVGLKKATDEQVEKWGKWLDEDDLLSREEGASNLGMSQNPKAIKYLLKALNDKEPTVRQGAAAGLANYSENEIIPTLKKILEKEQIWFVKYTIIETLQALNTEANFIFPFIKEMINDENCSGAELVRGIKEGVLQEELISEINANAKKGNSVAAQTHCAYVSIRYFKGDPNEFMDLFVKAIDPKNAADIKKVAIYGLKKIGNKAAIDALKKALDDEDPIIRSAASKSLKELEKGSAK